MKIHVLTEASVRHSMDVARLINADVVLEEKSESVTLAYPVSYQGNFDLHSLPYKQHSTGDGNFYYDMPFDLNTTIDFLNYRFNVELV